MTVTISDSESGINNDSVKGSVCGRDNDDDGAYNDDVRQG